MQQQRVLVTGGAGFIGSELVRQLAEENFTVRVVDNLVNGKEEHLRGASSSVELIVGDVRDTKLMNLLMRGIDIVFHLACLGVRHSIHSPGETHEVNSSATLGLLNVARNAGAKRFVYVSSSGVYGTARTVPISEEHPTFPVTIYGASKLAGEAYTRAFWETYRFPTVVVRPFDAYGPRCHYEGDSGEVIPKFMVRCMAGQPMVIFGNRTQTRDFTFVGDTARGILAAGLSDGCVGQTINLGSGKEIRIPELASAIAHLLGKAAAEIQYVEPQPGDVRRLLSDTSKAKRLLNFHTTINLDEGLARLRDWYIGQNKSPEELLQQEIVRNSQPRDVPTHV